MRMRIRMSLLVSGAILLAGIAWAESPKPPPFYAITDVKVVTGESVVLQVTATDRCGNAAPASYDPAEEPSPLCDVVLEDGSCCPPIGRPEPGSCGPDVCGEEARSAPGLARHR